MEVPKFTYPRIVFSDHDYAAIGLVIKGRTKQVGGWSHVMWQTEATKLATQGFGGYVKVGIDVYLKDGIRMKFIGLNGINEIGYAAILESIENKLKLPWWKRRYDWLGIIGQAIGLRFIQNPWTDYCSEDVPTHLKKAWLKVGTKGFSPEWAGIIKAMPQEMSPGTFNLFQKSFKTYFPLEGYWNSDE